MGILTDTEMKGGAQVYMRTFKFVYGCCLSEVLLRQTGNLSRALKGLSIPAAEGSTLAQIVVDTLLKDTDDERLSCSGYVFFMRKQI